jgi:hypothetical protein
VPFLGFTAMMLAGGLQNPNLQQSPIPTAVWLVATGLMVVCGLAAGVGILLKKPWAVLPGWIAVCLALVSMGANVVMLMGQLGTGGQTALLGELSGPMLVRIGLLIAYIVALSKYSKWVAARAQ